MTPQQFIAKWQRAALSERAASQEHFLDLCRLLGQPTPASHDATGAEYTFEKGVSVDGPASPGSKGAHGFADVWWRGKFAIEYKRAGKHKTLDAAYQQLNRYREPLANPPLLIVTDIHRFQIHTNFTGYVPTTLDIPLEDFDDPKTLDTLRRVFTDPESFKPSESREHMTAEVAKRFGELADALRKRHPDEDPLTIAHFLMKCMFCLFAEDVDLLPKDLFKSLLEKSLDTPGRLRPRLEQLFAAMASGGDFGIDDIAYFNGGLFKDGPTYDLTGPEIGTLILAAAKDWSGVDPSIFGTLFERSLDPTKRAQIGAHYTSRDDIMLVIEPVILRPLAREWEAAQQDIDKQLARRRKAKTPATKRKADHQISDRLAGYMQRLGSVRVLDPACGSGNFLFVAIQCLLDLEKQVIQYAAQPEISVSLLPNVRPTQLHGIEINPFAAELAQVVIWIGYLQWMRDNGFNVPRDPILEDLQTIQNRDAILAPGSVGSDHPQPADWPDADFIVGNPPFLGSKLFRKHGLPDDYIQAMYDAYDLPNTSDLVCYWFERARIAIEFAKKHGGKGFGKAPFGKGPFGRSPAKDVRVGLIATQGIRGGDNRKVLERIKKTGDIFMAWADRVWMLDGAAVQVSIVGFSHGNESVFELNGKVCASINSNLSHGADLTSAKKLTPNNDIWSVGTQKGGSFDLLVDKATQLLKKPNIRRLSNLEVVRPWVSGSDITARSRGKWIIYFDPEISMSDAAVFEHPFEYVREIVKPFRDTVRREAYRKLWWVHQEPRRGLDVKIKGLNRFLTTPMVTKHRVFTWLSSPTIPDKQVTVFLRSDDYFFGVLHSSVHELWARRMGTQLREAESGFRYTPTTCFETFALPWAPGEEDVMSLIDPDGSDPEEAGRILEEHEAEQTARFAAVQRIGEAAAELDALRENWLNPPEWIEPIEKHIDATDDFSDIPGDARPLIRRSAVMAAAAQDKNLKKRTLTNLYNQRPTWLKLAHHKLDRAVLAAYAHTDPPGKWDPAWADVWQDTGAGQPLPDGHPLTDRRAEAEQQVLANLLRLNQGRSSPGS